MRSASVAGIVLAAGFGSRMGGGKPLLDLAGRTLLFHAVRTLREGGVERIFVVAGHRGDEVAKSARELGCTPVPNPRFEEGMFSSVQAGVAALPEESGGFFLLPVDVPLVRGSTIRTLRTAQSSSHDILHPAFAGERGHPPLVGLAHASGILDWNGGDGLRGYLTTQESASKEISVIDRGILLDADTPEELAALETRARTLAAPDEEESRLLFDLATTPPEVRAHGEAVRKGVRALGESLVARGVEIDLPALEGAGLLHDIDKANGRDHAQKGAQRLREAGFPAVADIAAPHMDLESPPSAHATEAELLYLADKLIDGVELRTLAEREEAMRIRYGRNSSALGQALARLERARAILVQVERILDCGVLSLLNRVLAP